MSDEWDRMRDRVVGELRQDWLTNVRTLAALNEQWAANITAHGDEACGTSMEFVAQRLRALAEREARQ